MSLRLNPSQLSDIRAADYALLNAMLKSLIDENQYGEDAERVAHEFALSAQIRGEAERTGSRRAGDVRARRH